MNKRLLNSKYLPAVIIAPCVLIPSLADAQLSYSQTFASRPSPLPNVVQAASGSPILAASPTFTDLYEAGIGHSTSTAIEVWEGSAGTFPGQSVGDYVMAFRTAGTNSDANVIAFIDLGSPFDTADGTLLTVDFDLVERLVNAPFQQGEITVALYDGLPTVTNNINNFTIDQTPLAETTINVGAATSFYTDDYTDSGLNIADSVSRQALVFDVTSSSTNNLYLVFNIDPSTNQGFQEGGIDNIFVNQQTSLPISFSETFTIRAFTDITLDQSGTPTLAAPTEYPSNYYEAGISSALSGSSASTGFEIWEGTSFPGESVDDYVMAFRTDGLTGDANSIAFIDLGLPFDPANGERLNVSFDVVERTANSPFQNGEITIAVYDGLPTVTKDPISNNFTIDQVALAESVIVVGSKDSFYTDDYTDNGLNIADSLSRQSIDLNLSLSTTSNLFLVIETDPGTSQGFQEVGFDNISVTQANIGPISYAESFDTTGSSFLNIELNESGTPILTASPAQYPNIYEAGQLSNAFSIWNPATFPGGGVETLLNFRADGDENAIAFIDLGGKADISNGSNIKIDFDVLRRSDGSTFQNGTITVGLYDGLSDVTEVVDEQSFTIDEPPLVEQIIQITDIASFYTEAYTENGFNVANSVASQSLTLSLPANTTENLFLVFTIASSDGASAYREAGLDNIVVTQLGNVVSFPALTTVPPINSSLLGTNLIPNGDFASLANQVPASPANNEWNVTGSKGDYSLFVGQTADVVGWSHYFEDPNSVVPAVGTPQLNDGNGELDSTFYLDTVINSSGVLTLNSTAGYTNGLQQEDILNGVSIDTGKDYVLTIDVVEPAYISATGSTFTAALTSGTDAANFANAIAGGLISSAGSDLLPTFGLQPLQVVVSGADLAAAGQVNIAIQNVISNSIPGFPGSVDPSNVSNISLVSQVKVESVSLAEIATPTIADFDLDGNIDQADIDLANSYFDGSIDDGLTAVERQDILVSQGNTSQQALDLLNLTRFDVDSDGDFDADDITLINEITIAPALKATSFTGGLLSFEWSSHDGFIYQLESATTLTPPNWSIYNDGVTTFDNITGDNDGTNTLSGVQAVGTDRYFRIVETATP